MAGTIRSLWRRWRFGQPFWWRQLSVRLLALVLYEYLYLRIEEYFHH